MPTYVCHACDEDLTAAVERKAGLADDDVAMDEVGPSADRRRWKIVVQCTKGHENVFEGEGGDDEDWDEVAEEEEE